MNEPCCETCFYGRPVPNNVAYIQCCRYPPSLLPDTLNYYQPEFFHTIWCGEFKFKSLKNETEWLEQPGWRG